MRIERLALFAAAAAALTVSSACSAKPAPATTAGVTDFYLSPDILRGKGETVSDAALRTPGISGVFLRASWDAINPAPGKYDFSELDPIVAQAVRAGKKLSIGVVTGDAAPDWLGQQGVAVANVQVQYVKLGCQATRVPAVWSDTYVDAYLKMMAALKDHLVRTGAFDAVKIIKMSGVTKRTLELSLPNNNRCSQTVDDQLAQIGYRPGKLLIAWERMAKGIAGLFPGRIVSQPIYQVQGFPSIDDNGRPIARQQVDVGSRIIARCIADFGSLCGVQWNGLNRGGVISQRVMDAKQQGATIGWQTNMFGSGGGEPGAGCNANRQQPRVMCTPDTYRQLIQRGVDAGASFIEVWEADVRQFPNAFVGARTN